MSAATGVAVVLFACHAVVLGVNFARAPVTYGYDWPGHFTYLYHVAEYWQPPPPDVSAQFFNPPFYYFSVAAFQRVSGVPLVRAGHVFNLLLAVATYTVLVALCRRVWRDHVVPTAWLLGLYVCNPTVYRTFGMVRPEALVLFFFVVALWFVVRLVSPRPRWLFLSLGSGLIAGLTFGVRQWGAFLEAALVLWMLVEGVRRATSPAERWRAVGYAVVQGAAFVCVAALFMLWRGDDVLAFNAPARLPDLEFVTCLASPELFSTPVRPNLNGCFWPTLYADFWGDYWRYWREARWHDPLPTSPETLAALARAMWAALPVTVAALAGVLCRTSSEVRLSAAPHRFVRILVGASLVGFLIFASLYAEPGKGDTVKGVYVVYLVPCLAWLVAIAMDWLTERFSAAAHAALLPLALIAVMLIPVGIYCAPEQWASRSWEMPAVGQTAGVTFGEAITLVGYDVVLDAEMGTLGVRLVWRADAYTGRGHKVFVHVLDAGGQLVTQSDAVPAGWQRPTYAWMLGEYIVDEHALATSQPSLDDVQIRVGLYDARDGTRLLTASGVDYVELGD